MLRDVTVKKSGKMFNIALNKDGGNVMTENGIWNNVFEIELFVGENEFELGLYDANGEYTGSTTIKEWGAFDLNDNPIDMDDDAKITYFIDNGKLTSFISGEIIGIECDGEKGVVKVYEFDERGMRVDVHMAFIDLSYDDSEVLSNVLSMLGSVTERNYIAEDSKLDMIAKEISEMEDMPNTPDCNYHRTCIMVAQDLYGASTEQAIEIADIIQKKYLEY